MRAVHCRALVVVISLALLGAACSSSKHATKQTASTTTAASGKGITSEAQLVAQIQANGPTPATAAQLFALDVGPLPGVSVAGITPDPENLDATEAVGYLDDEWTQLTPAQRDAAKKLLAPVKTLRSAKTSAARSASSRPMAVTVAARTGASPSPVLTDSPQFNYLKLAQDANAAEAPALKRPPIDGFNIDLVDVVTKTYALTRYYQPDDNGGWERWPGGCDIVVFEFRWDAVDAEDAASIISHEVFHCFQQREAGLSAKGVPNWFSVHDWIGEGEATWVMAELHPSATSVVAGKWSRYTLNPETKYFDRDYDGIGLYGHLGDVLGDQKSVWLLLLPTFVAGVGGNDSTAWNTLIAGVSERYYNTWGASYYIDGDHANWKMSGPGTPAPKPTPRAVNIGAGDGQEIGLEGLYQSAQTDITSDADVLVVMLTSGYGSAHDQDFKVDATLDTSAPLKLCLNANGCKCPDGSPGASEFTTRATSPISVGMNGGDQHLAAYAAGDSLDKWCKDPDPQPPGPGGPPPPPGGGGGDGGAPEDQQPPQGISEGDPHLSTFDGTAYDLQTVGEMTLVKSTTDDFTVQVRTAQLPGTNGIAVNTAVATQLAGHRIEIAPENGVIQAHLAGKLVIDEVVRVGKGTLQRLDTAAGQGFVIEYPDSTTVRVDPLGLAALNVTVKPSPARAGKLVGLLGNDDRKNTNDYVTSTGHDLGSVPTRAALNTTFTDSWRITQAESLFSYGPGQSTATFTDKSLPRVDIGASNAPNHAAIEQQCRNEGITDQYLLQDCVVDAAEMHANPVVFSHYVQAQAVATTRAAIAQGLTPFAGGSAPAPGSSTTTTTQPVGALRTVVDAGRVNATAETVSFGFPAHAGDVIWIGAPNCDAQLTFALKDPSGTVLNADQVSLGVPVCIAGRFVLKADGTYQLVANADKNGSGSYTVPIRFQRADVVSQAAYGQTITGTIPMVAAHDVYRFDAKAGDQLHLFGAGCNVGPQNSAVGLQKADGMPVGPVLDCTPQSEYLVQASGSYQLVVNFTNAGPFSYSFMLQK